MAEDVFELVADAAELVLDLVSSALEPVSDSLCGVGELILERLGGLLGCAFVEAGNDVNKRLRPHRTLITTPFRRGLANVIRQAD